jgi:type I restriction enzyme S subunit
MLDIITDNIDIWTSAKAPNATGGRGRSKNGGRIQYGVKKLRELILELAVRGKLVPQDIKDEPASALLGEIAKEKARLIKEGVIRREKESPRSSPEAPYQIPKGWKWGQLINLYYSISTSGKKLKSSEIVDKGKYPVVDQGQSYIAGFTNEPELLIRIPGPVIIFGDHTTEIKYIDFDFVAGADGTKILRPYKMYEKYFYIYLKSFKLENRGYARHFKVLNEALMALPPLAEQRRIVEKVDELMSLCDQLEQQQTASDAAHKNLIENLLDSLTNTANADEFQKTWKLIENNFETLFTTGRSVNQLMQNIRRLSIMGKLVPQDLDDEPATLLLERISEKSKSSKKLKLVTKEKPVEIPFSIPENWAWSHITEVITNDKYAIKRGPFGSSIRKSFFVSSGYKVYEQQHAINEDFSLGKYYIDKRKFEELKAFEVKPGDLIISCSGTVGKIAAAPKWMEPGIINQALLKITLNQSVLTNDYFKILFPSFFMQTKTLSDLQGTAQKNIVSVDILKNEPFPLPPLAEQHRIVAKVDELMAICDSFKKRLYEAQLTQTYLADAIVEQATLT